MKQFTQYIPYKQEFVVIKPGFLNREKVVLDILKNSGFQLIKSLSKQLTYNEAKELYIPHKKESFYRDLCKYMSSGVSEGFLFDNPESVDMDELKDKIRDKWGIDEMRNVIHSSDSPENVNRESKIYFGKL